MTGVIVCTLLFSFQPATMPLQRIDLDEDIRMDRNMASDLRREVEGLVREAKYAQAWAKSAALVPGTKYSSTVAQYDALNFMARIALADPKLKENGKERLEVAVDVLHQFLKKMERAEKDYKTALSLDGPRGYLAETTYTLAVLALACGESDAAVELLDKVYDLSFMADLWRNEEARPRRRMLLSGLSRYLALFGRADKAAKLLERHWPLVEGGTWKSSHAIRGMALFKVATILEEQGNLPAAIRFYMQAHSHLQAAKDMDSAREKVSVKEAREVAFRKTRIHRVWTGVKRKEVTYEDHRALRKTFQALADEFSDAFERRDVEAALKLVAEPESRRQKIVKIFHGSEPRSLTWSISSVGPVKTTDNRVSIMCECTAISRIGAKTSGAELLTATGGKGPAHPRSL